jgi:diacylglycerol kinase (ATP)
VLESPDAEAVRNALKSRVDVVLVFGGDGTVNRHLAQLAKTNLPMLAVPAGSGNDLARAAGMPAVDDAVAAWMRFLSGTAHVSAVDLGVIASGTLSEPRYFSCCANIGLDADAARRTDKMPDWMKSRGGYFIGGLLALARYRPEMMSVRSSEKDFSENAWFISVSNTPTFGGGLNIAPQASIRDGQLDITFAGADRFSRAALAGHFPKIFSGQHIDLPGLEIFRTARAEVEAPAAQLVYADGEYITETPCRIHVSPGALRLVTLL